MVSGTLHKLTFYAVPAEQDPKGKARPESEHYFAAPELIQPSLNITCCRAPFRLVWEGGVVNKHPRTGQGAAEQVGRVEAIATARLIITEPEHL